MSAGVPPIALLYEDAALVVVDKPAGVPVIPAPGSEAAACVQHRVAALIGTRAWVVHRLDRDTSGALVFARTAEAHRALSMAFEHRDVHKRYLAIVAGAPPSSSGVIDVPLAEARKGKARPAHDGEAGARPATTAYQVLRRWHGAGHTAALVQAEPHTGRHHQIRVHLRAIGVPILSDAVYGRGGLPLAAMLPSHRLALHASGLDLPHPSGAGRVQVEAPLPADLTALVAWLDAHWTAEPTS